MSLADTRDPNSLSSKLRRKRDVKIREIIDDIYAHNHSVSIIDIGGTVGYWERVGLDFLRSKNVSVSLVNLHATELGALGTNGDIMTNIVGDGCALNLIADNQFDLAHSNSVIEHVGSWSNMKNFADEFRRIAKAYYIQTPYFWFPVDPHFYKMPFFHWLPWSLRTRFLRMFPLAFKGKISGVDEARSILEGAVLLDRSEMEFLFPDAMHQYERFLGLPKSLLAIRN